MPKGVILCQKNDAIQIIRVYIDSMCRRLDLKWSKLVFHLIKYWNFFWIKMISNAFLLEFLKFFMFSDLNENNLSLKLLKLRKNLYERMGHSVWLRLDSSVFTTESSLECETSLKNSYVMILCHTRHHNRICHSRFGLRYFEMRNLKVNDNAKPTLDS